MTELSILKALLLILALLPLISHAATDETALLQKLEQVEQQAASPAARQWLRELVGYQELERTPHPDHPALDLPRHDIAARAKALLQRWDILADYEQLLRAPQQQLKRAAGPVQQQARIRWIQQASPSQLEAFRQNQPVQALPEAVLLALTQTQANHHVDRELARRAQSRAALAHLHQRLLQLPAQQGEALLQALRKNPALRGGLAQIQADWLSHNPAQLQSFTTRWHAQDWSTESVSTALQLRPDNLLPALTTALSDPSKAALAAWALWRLNVPAALQALANYSESDQAVAHLAQEIRTWLR